MNDADIIKALEFCASKGRFKCDGCPFRFKDENCRNKTGLALDLINRQKADIERLRIEKDNLIKTYKECMTEAITEFERRLGSCGVKSIEVGHFDNKSYEFITIRKDRFDQIAKEMKEGANNA